MITDSPAPLHSSFWMMIQPPSVSAARCPNRCTSAVSDALIATSGRHIKFTQLWSHVKVSLYHPHCPGVHIRSGLACQKTTGGCGTCGQVSEIKPRHMCTLLTHCCLLTALICVWSWTVWRGSSPSMCWARSMPVTSRTIQ